MIIDRYELSSCESVMNSAISASVEMMEWLALNRWTGFECYAIEENTIVACVASCLCISIENDDP
jgi:hypothetical protein